MFELSEPKPIFPDPLLPLDIVESINSDPVLTPRSPIKLQSIYFIEDTGEIESLSAIYAEGFHDLDDFVLAIAEENCCSWEFIEMGIEGHDEDGNYDDDDNPLLHFLEHLKSKVVCRWFRFTDDDYFVKSASFVIDAFPATCFYIE